MKRDHLQTMAVAFQEMCAGERDWTALGNFMNYWYGYAKDRREALVTDPLPTAPFLKGDENKNTEKIAWVGPTGWSVLLLHLRNVAVCRMDQNTPSELLFVL